MSQGGLSSASLDTGFPTGRRPPTTVSKFSLPTSAAALRGRREQGQWAGLPQPQWQICFMKAFENSTLHSTTQDKVPYTRDFPVLYPGSPTARIGELRGVGDLFISARPQAELGPRRQLPGHGCTPTPCRPRSPHLTRHTWGSVSAFVLGLLSGPRFAVRGARQAAPACQTAVLWGGLGAPRGER